MIETAGTPRTRLRHKLYGFWASQCLYVAVHIGLPDQMGDEDHSPDELGAVLGQQPASLRRLLRALASIGIVRESGHHRFALSDEGTLLRSEADGTLRNEVLHMLHPSCWASWGDLAGSVESGAPSFPRIHGMPAWQYRSAHPEAADAFYRWAADAAASQQRAIVAALGDPGRVVVDVGGGRGDLLAAVLRAHPSAHGMVFEIPTMAQEGVVSRNPRKFRRAAPRRVLVQGLDELLLLQQPGSRRLGRADRSPARWPASIALW